MKSHGQFVFDVLFPTDVKQLLNYIEEYQVHVQRRSAVAPLARWTVLPGREMVHWEHSRKANVKSLGVDSDHRSALWSPIQRAIFKQRDSRVKQCWLS